MSLELLKRKIFLLIGRAILSAINNTEKTQKIQVTLLKDETVTDIERFQEYGFETYPKVGSAEAVIAFLNGNRDHGIVLCVHDREFRPVGLSALSAGEVMMYDWQGSKVYFKSDGSVYSESKSGSKVDMKADGSYRIDDKNGNYIKSDATKWDINGNLTVDK